jgi:lipid A ethanolaminephosphotransferase
VFVGSLFSFVTAIFVLVLSAVCHRSTVKPVLITFLMLSSVIAYFSIKYGTVFDYQMLSNVLTTDTAEARDLLNVELIPYVLALGIVPSLGGLLRDAQTSSLES